MNKELCEACKLIEEINKGNRIGSSLIVKPGPIDRGIAFLLKDKCTCTYVQPVDEYVPLSFEKRISLDYIYTFGKGSGWFGIDTEFIMEVYFVVEMTFTYKEALLNKPVALNVTPCRISFYTLDGSLVDAVIMPLCNIVGNLESFRKD